MTDLTAGRVVRHVHDGIAAARGDASVPSELTATVEIVVPVYNEERALTGCVEVLHDYLKRHFPFEWTITVADNASTDRTLAIAAELAERYPSDVRVLRLDRKGRGRALRTAWTRSEADVVVYMDVDLFTGLDALLPLAGRPGIRPSNGSSAESGARRSGWAYWWRTCCCWPASIRSPPWN